MVRNYHYVYIFFKWMQFVTLISPVFTYVLLVYISGVRLLEASGKERWGHLESYQEYLKKTPSLIFK